VFDREYVVHGDEEYVAGDVHVNTGESHTSLARRWLLPIEVSPKIGSKTVFQAAL